MRLQRIGAIVQRNLFLFKRNTARLFDLFFWPIVDLAVWGFLTTYLIGNGSGRDLPPFVTFFLGSLILWNILHHASLGTTIGFLEDLWTRNFLNLFASPLRPIEYVASLVIASLLRVAIAGSVIIAAAAVLYAFNIFSLGPPLVLLFLNLIVMGISVGIITISIILRLGQNAEILAWALIFLLMPVSAVYYPVAILPPALRAVAAVIPSSHVFEGMRAVLTTGSLPMSELAWALGLNILYFTVAVCIFFAVFRSSLKSGRLARTWQ